MKKLPIDLQMVTKTTKVSVAAWDRAQQLKEKLGCRLADVVSAALLYIEEDRLKRILDDQQAALDELPKAVKMVLKNLDSLSEADREALKKLL